MVLADVGVVGDDSESTEREPAGDDGTRRDLTRRLPAVAIVAAVAPILVAGVRAVLRGWTPTGDDSYSALRAWDLFTSNPPLLGTWSSAALYTGHQINHPGPLQFDLLAVPVRLLGHGPGTALGLAAINATAVALLGWLVLRRLGPAAATASMGLAALLAWAMGSEMLYSPWSQHAPLLPFALFLVAVWCAASGDLVALPIMVVAGNYSLQTHLSYSILVPGLLLFAVAVTVGRVGRAWRRRQSDAGSDAEPGSEPDAGSGSEPDAWPTLRNRTLRWGAIAIVAQLVVGLQPLVEQVFGSGEGNLTALAHSASADAPTPGMGATIRALGGTLVLPPAWLPPSFGSPAFHLNGDGPPTALAAAGLVLLIAALAVLGWRAWRRGSQVVAAGAATGLMAMTLAFVTIPRAPIRWGLAPTYVRWMWPLGMVLWLVLVVAVLDELRVRAERRRTEQAAGASSSASGTNGHGAEAPTGPTTPAPAGRPGWVWPGFALAVFGCIGALPMIDNGSSSPPWTVDAVQAVDQDVVAAAEDAGSVLVEFSPHMSTGAAGPPLLIALQDAGIPFYVTDEPMIRQVGEPRRYEPGDATAKLYVIAARDAEPQPGQTLVAEWSELSRAEESELTRLTDQVEDLVDEHGLPLDDGAEAYLRSAGDQDMLDRIAAMEDDPDEAVASGLVGDLWFGPHAKLRGDGPLLDTEVFPTEMLDRWYDLRTRHELHVLKVFISPL